MWWPTRPLTKRSQALLHPPHGPRHLSPGGRGGAAAALPITGRVIQLQLPHHLEDISSSRIRENVDLNRDISNFIDPVIQDFIYQNGLYLRDSQDKPLLYAGDLEFQWVKDPSPLLLADITAGHPEGEALRSAIIRKGGPASPSPPYRGGREAAGLCQLPLSGLLRPVPGYRGPAAGGPPAAAGGGKGAAYYCPGCRPDRPA